MKSNILKLTLVLSALFICNLNYGQTSKDYKSTNVSGFNKGLEPSELKLYTDGHIELVINNFEQVLNNSTNEKFVTNFWLQFENEMSKKLNIVTSKKEKNIFIIQNGNEETVIKIKKYLENYWN